MIFVVENINNRAEFRKIDLTTVAKLSRLEIRRAGRRPGRVLARGQDCLKVNQEVGIKIHRSMCTVKINK